MVTCPLCAWTMERLTRAVTAHHLRTHLRVEHGLCLAETVRRANALSLVGVGLAKE